MAINIAHRPDLDRRVEVLALRLGLRGRGRKTRVIERALESLETRSSAIKTTPEEIDAFFKELSESTREMRKRFTAEFPGMSIETISRTLQDELYDKRGLPK